MTCPVCGEADLERFEGGLAPYLACPVCGYACFPHRTVTVVTDQGTVITTRRPIT